MRQLPLIVHERLGFWARQLRPRLAGWPVHLVESRSATDLKLALERSACPLVVLDLRGRGPETLDDVALAVRLASNALLLVLDPGAQAGLPELARELGATHVISGVVPPPVVAELLARWVPLALRRVELDGWAADRDPGSECSNALPAFSPIARA